MNGAMKEVRCRTRGVGSELMQGDKVWKLGFCLYADDAVLLAKSEKDLQWIVDESENVCT